MNGRRGRRTWAGVTCAALGTLLGLGRVGDATADEIPTVIIDPAGPDRAMPLGSDFYVAGPLNGEDVAGMYVVFVRYSYSIFGSDLHAYKRPKSCVEVRGALSTLKEKNFTPNLGVVKIDRLWARPANESDRANYDGLNQFHEALVAGPWERKKTTDEQFKVFVARNSFFRPGAKYCTLMYDVRKESPALEPAQKAVSQLQADWATCSNILATTMEDIDKKPLKVDERNKAKEDAEKARETCYQNALKTFEKAVKDSIQSFVQAQGVLSEDEQHNIEKKKAEIDKEINRLVGPAMSKHQSWGEAQKIAKGWLRDTITPVQLALYGTAKKGTDLLGQPPPQSGAIDSDPLAAFVVGMLAMTQGSIVVTYDKASQKFSYDLVSIEKGVEKKFTVKYLGVKDTLDGVHLASDLEAPGAQKKSLDVDLKKITFPDSNVSLAEMVEFARGRVWSGNRYVPVGEAVASLLPTNAEASLGAQDIEKILALGKRLEAIHAVLVRAWKARNDMGSTVHPHPNSPAIYGNLGLWFNDVLRKCQPPAVCNNDPLKNGWPGHALEAPNDLERLSVHLLRYAEKAKAWNEVTADLRTTLATTVVKAPSGKPLDARAAMTAEKWVWSYVTPVTGWAYLPALSGVAMTGLIGVQVYFYPNSVDEPMWSNGFAADLHRLFSVQAAIGTSRGPFGADGRYGGFANANLPPLFLGLAAQPIPYVTLSAGAAFMSQRSSTLVQERQTLHVSPYFSVAVQANIPDMVAAIRGRKLNMDSD